MIAYNVIMDDEIPCQCCCDALVDFVVLPMGGIGFDSLVLASFKQMIKHGGDQWWLYASTCLVCRQNWMIAQDERIYDNYYLRRLSPELMTDVIEFDWWPDEFLTYEQVLRLGRTTGRFWRFVDPCSPALVTTAEDLRRERPDISVEEIAYLLGIPASNAANLLG